MGLIRFDQDRDHHVTEQYSTGRGPVLRSENLEVTLISWDRGGGGKEHRHAEEQFFFVVSGKLRVTLEQETYEVAAGEGSFHPANALHSNVALEDTTALSVKTVVSPFYEATGELA